MSKSPNLTLVFFGSGGVGKTSIIHRKIYDTFDEEYDPTIEDDLTTSVYLGNTPNDKYICKVIDSSGQFDFYPEEMLRKQYLSGDGFIVVYDITNKQSFNTLKKESIDGIYQILNLRSNINNSLNEIPIIICGNKCDLSNREVESDIVEKYAKNIDALFIETSAKNDINIQTLFKLLVRNIIDKYPNIINDKLNNESNNTNNNKCCVIL